MIGRTSSSPPSCRLVANTSATHDVLRTNRHQTKFNHFHRQSCSPYNLKFRQSQVHEHERHETSCRTSRTGSRSTPKEPCEFAPTPPSDVACSIEDEMRKTQSVIFFSGWLAHELTARREQSNRYATILPVANDWLMLDRVPPGTTEGVSTLVFAFGFGLTHVSASSRGCGPSSSSRDLAPADRAASDSTSPSRAMPASRWWGFRPSANRPSCPKSPGPSRRLRPTRLRRLPPYRVCSSTVARKFKCSTCLGLLKGPRKAKGEADRSFPPQRLHNSRTGFRLSTDGCADERPGFDDLGCDKTRRAAGAAGGRARGCRYPAQSRSTQHLPQTEESWRHENHILSAAQEPRRENALQYLAGLQNAEL